MVWPRTSQHLGVGTIIISNYYCNKHLCFNFYMKLNAWKYATYSHYNVRTWTYVWPLCSLHPILLQQSYYWPACKFLFCNSCCSFVHYQLLLCLCGWQPHKAWVPWWTTSMGWAIYEKDPPRKFSPLHLYWGLWKNDKIKSCVKKIREKKWKIWLSYGNVTEFSVRIEQCNGQVKIKFSMFKLINNKDINLFICFYISVIFNFQHTAVFIIYH